MRDGLRKSCFGSADPVGDSNPVVPLVHRTDKGHCADPRSGRHTAHLRLRRIVSAACNRAKSAVRSCKLVPVYRYANLLLSDSRCRLTCSEEKILRRQPGAGKSLSSCTGWNTLIANCPLIPLRTRLERDPLQRKRTRTNQRPVYVFCGILRNGSKARGLSVPRSRLA